MKVKCIRNDNGFDKYVTIGKIYEVEEIFLSDGAFVIYHDKGKGMIPIICFDILEV